tara:strand:+ start:2239 stop:2859 length:621 start_codon:yes stop_codon:yes gene_type:complete
MTTLDGIRNRNIFRHDEENTGISNEIVEIKEYSFVDVSKIGVPLKDFRRPQLYHNVRFDYNDRIKLVRPSKQFHSNPESAYKVRYVDIFEQDLILDSLYNYHIKKKDCQTRRITVTTGMIYNESEEILVMITKSVTDESFILYYATELIKEPIYASLYSKLKKYLIKPFEEEDLTVIRMNMRKLTELFYPNYEEEPLLPITLTLND